MLEESIYDSIYGLFRDVPAQRPITKMTIKINYSHRARGARPMVGWSARKPRIRDAEIVGGTNQFT